MKIAQEQRNRLVNASVAFCLRVLSGNGSPEECKLIPQILTFLTEEESAAKMRDQMELLSLGKQFAEEIQKLK